MTHDELLAKIDYWFDTDNFHLHKNALRAVVELHTSEFDCLICAGADGTCPTIQAIEKELG
jgi:diacylglycerol kinase family enzyme